MAKQYIYFYIHPDELRRGNVTSKTAGAATIWNTFEDAALSRVRQLKDWVCSPVYEIVMPEDAFQPTEIPQITPSKIDEAAKIAAAVGHGHNCNCDGCEADGRREAGCVTR